MKIALATCEGLPDWEVDDAPFHRALLARGVTLDHPVWDDPAVDWAAFDAVLVRTTWDYQDKAAAFVDWIDQVASCTRLFNPRETLLWNSHKSYLAELEAAGVPIVETLWLDAGSTADVGSLVRAAGWTKGFLKPMVGANARESIRFDMDVEGIARAQAHVDRLLPTEGLMLQPYVVQVETIGEISTLYFDGAFSHAVQKIPVSGDFRVQDDFGATDFPVVLSPAFREASDRAVEAVGGNPLYARVDLHTGDEGEPLVGEVELIEPSLFFRHDAGAADRLADALLARIRKAGRT